MATQKTATKKTAASSRVRVATPVSVVPDTPPADLGELVVVHVPKEYVLTRDDGSPIRYTAGTHRMPEKDVEHWFSKANGVERA